MSRLCLALILVLASSRIALGATVVSVTFHDKDHRPAGAIVLYVIQEDARSAWHVGVTLVRPDSKPAGLETRLALPTVREWSRLAARVEQLWRARIVPCAGIRFLLPRL